MFNVYGTEWALIYCHPNNANLQRPDGVFTLGVADNNCKTVYIADNLTPKLELKVVIHELCHCYCFETGYQVEPEIEEMIADFVSIFGVDIIETANYIMDNYISKIEMLGA